MIKQRKCLLQIPRGKTKESIEIRLLWVLGFYIKKLTELFILYFYYGLFVDLLEHRCTLCGYAYYSFQGAVKYLQYKIVYIVSIIYSITYTICMWCFKKYLGLSEDGMDYLRELVNKQDNIQATKWWGLKPSPWTRVLQLVHQRHSWTLSFRIIPTQEAPSTVTSKGEKVAKGQGPIEALNRLPSRQLKRRK